MSLTLLNRRPVVAGAMTLLAALAATGLDAQRPAPMAIGVEYVLIDKADKVGPYARELAQTGITAAKHYAEHVEWNEMQKSARAPYAPRETLDDGRQPHPNPPRTSSTGRTPE